jgi:hypothetical protein
MAAGTWQLTNTTRTKLINGQFDMDTDTFKIALFTNASNLTVASTAFSGVTSEVGTINTGYTAGGILITFDLAGTTSVTVKIHDNPGQPTWTAGSANLTAKYAAIYEVSGDVVCLCTLDAGGADITATSGNTLTVDGKTNPVMTIA